AFIQSFGHALSKTVRSHDIVIRIGGDEFLVILTGLTREMDKRHSQIMHIIRRIRDELAAGWMIEDHQFTPTASIGISYYPDHAQTLDELMDLADQALYKSKEAGKNNLFISEAH
ncbi:MAG: GGDEF domain-containing protein, partial [Lysinibacillus fusiformis]|nr:GGDEF domain-containing protein [Lysinibacillus fusiformis]